MSELNRPVYNRADAITPSDTVDLPNGPCDAIWVGGAGNVVVVFAPSRTATFGCAAGSVLPVKAQRVNSTNTTGTALLALYQV